MCTKSISEGAFNVKATTIISTLVLTALFVLMFIGNVAFAATQPELYYDFEEQAGSTVTNRGTLGGNGTIMNTPGWITGTPGNENGGYRFNGLKGASAANYIHTGFTPAQLGIYDAEGYASFTLVCWVQGGNTNGDEMVFGQPNNPDHLHCGLRNGEPHLGLYGDDLHFATALPTGSWNHIVFQLTDSNVQHLFLNGVLINSRQSSGSGLKLNDILIIGTTHGSIANTVNGAVDDVAVFSDVLSLEQIQFLASGGNPLHLPDLTGGELGYFTAATGSDGTWNLYRVVGHRTGAYLTWWEAHQMAGNSLYEGIPGHLATINSITENEFCRHLCNRGSTHCFIGLTDNENFSGAYESGTPEQVPLEERRVNGWVWVNGEPYDATTFNNWGVGEPNQSGNGEDGTMIRADGCWNDIASGIPESGENTNSKYPAIVEWSINSPEPIPGATVISPILPDSAEMPGADLRVDGSFVGVWMRKAGEIDNLRIGSKLLCAGEGTLIITNQGIPVINFSDHTQANMTHRTLFPNNQLYFADIEGVVDTHWTAFYRSKIVVPAGEGGLYTFGVHSDDGFALRIPGQSWISVHGKGYFDYSSRHKDTIMYEHYTTDSDTRGIIALSSGIHDIEFLVCNSTGGQHHELYSARGAFTNDADTTTWRLVGHKKIGELKYVELTGNWDIWHSLTGADNLNLAWDVMQPLIAENTNHSIWDEINFYDPENGNGHDNILLESAPFPWNTAADDDDKILFAQSTLNIPEGTTIGLGFFGDDNIRLVVSNQTWSSIVFAEKPASTSILSDSLQCNSASGMTIGSIDLIAGTYPVSVLHREGGGSSHLDVFQTNLEAYDAQLPNPLVFRALSPEGAEKVQDIDGLQLYKYRNMLLIVH
jgi:hypothetical protein